MLDNRKLLAVAITVSIIGVAALFFYAASIDPEPLAISEIGDDDIGSLVTVNGTVRTFRSLDDGSISYEIVDLDTNASIVVYVNTKAAESTGNSVDSAGPGCVIQATGTVEKYQDVFEIVVSSGGNFFIISDASENRMPIWLLLSSPELCDGMTVWTNGTLHDPYLFDEGMGFELAENYEGKAYYLSCVCFDEEILLDYDIGDELSVLGTFQYYEPTGSWQLVIDGEENLALLP
ncbi:MAG: OB-fold nucleic acid binding domain-containing protein [Thermoplasmata archaeon]|nr:OB-fold nucleic acid binding domain-containing protein [Thermoplasmata archaeon]